MQATSKTSGEEDKTEDNEVRSRANLAMIYDDEGNAMQVQLGNYYRDSVHRSNDSSGRACSDRSFPQKDGSNNRVHLPAPLSRGLSDDSSKSGSSSSSESEGDCGVENVEEEYDYDYSDLMNNQCMRIAIPAAKLKDVSRVKKDLYHDKPSRAVHGELSAMKILRKASSISRGMSFNKSEDSESRRSPKGQQVSMAPSSKVSASQIGRMMSLPRQGKTSTGLSSSQSHQRQGNFPDSKQEMRKNTGVDSSQKRHLQGSGLRRSISSVGRMLSLSKSKEKSTSSPQSSEKVAEHPDGVTLSEMSQSTERPVGVLDSQKVSNVASVPGVQAQGLSERCEVPLERQSKANSGQRTALRQFGRMMSMSRAKSMIANENVSNAGREDFVLDESSPSLREDRERREADATSGSAGRGTLARVGRSLSTRLRSKSSLSSAQSPGSSSSVSYSPQSLSDPPGDLGDLSSKAHSLLSSSSLVSPVGVAKENAHKNAISSTPERSRNSSNSSTISRKEATKKSLRAAGRALSFSRKSGKGKSIQEPCHEDSLSSTQRRKAQDTAAKWKAERDILEPLSPDKLDGRGNKFFFAEVHSGAILSSGLLEDGSAQIRVPVIAMAEYAGPVSKGRWYIDAFTLPHNAVRRECIDLYDILISLADIRSPCDISKDDISDFKDWWLVASSFVECYFEMERKVLFPWIDEAGSQDKDVHAALRKMRGMKDTLKALLSKVNEAFCNSDEKRPEETFMSVYSSVDEFAPKLMNYFADQEILLPAIVREFYNLEDRLKMDKEMVSFFLGASVATKVKDCPNHNIILLCRWIMNPRQHRSWISKNLNSAARNMFPRWQQAFENGHHRIVRSFRNRSNSSIFSSE